MKSSVKDMHWQLLDISKNLKLNICAVLKWEGSNSRICLQTTEKIEKLICNINAHPQTWMMLNRSGTLENRN
jgi:hypothetical protein